MARQTGIRVRHSRSCPTRSGGACGRPCRPSYEAAVYSKRDGKKIRQTFANESEARAWRHDAAGEVRRGKLKAPSRITLREAALAWLEGAKSGTIRTRSGDKYKPSAIRGYETALNARLLPELGASRLSEIRRPDVQDLADRMLGEGFDPSTIRNTLMPLRAIFRRALVRGDVSVNPTTGLELAAVRGRRDRIASPDEAGQLLAALPISDRALWATAMYGGLRRGELMALRWDDVDLAAGKINVERSWDVKAGAIEPKSSAGKRAVPIAAVLRDFLLEHKLRLAWSEGLVFGRTASSPFDPRALARRAETAWRHESTRRAENEKTALKAIALHECRHTFASLMIAAGVNAKALSTYMGHSSITITLDRYGHLMPGNEEEAAELLDAYLARADTQTRLAQVSS